MKGKYIVIFALAALTAAALWYLGRGPDQRQAEELLEKTFARQEYSFRARAEVAADGAVIPYFDLEGQVEGENSRLKGTVLGEEVELSYAGGQLDQLLPDGSRVSHRLSDLGELAGLYAELLPGSAFDYRGVAAFGSRRTERGRELLLTPESCGGWVDEFFCDPLYIIGCGPLGLKVKYITLQATEKVNGRARLTLTVEFPN